MSEAAGIGGRVERVYFLGHTALLSVPASPSDADRRHHAGGVSQEIEAKHSYADREAWEEDEPRRDFDVLLASDR
jgi:hypothetical protein